MFRIDQVSIAIRPRTVFFELLTELGCKTRPKQQGFVLLIPETELPELYVKRNNRVIVRQMVNKNIVDPVKNVDLLTSLKGSELYEFEINKFVYVTGEILGTEKCIH